MTQTKSSKEEERMAKRRAANRKSAQKSRYRESVLLTELQNSASQLSNENETLRKRNDEYRKEAETLQSLIKETGHHQQRKEAETLQSLIKVAGHHQQSKVMPENEPTPDASVLTSHQYTLPSLKGQNLLSQPPTPITSFHLSNGFGIAAKEHHAQQLPSMLANESFQILISNVLSAGL